MIKSVTAINSNNEKLKMTLSTPEESGVLITNIDGLNPPKSDISMTNSPVIDGSFFNFARANNRNIVMDLRYIDSQMSIEEVRHLVYKIFKVKDLIRLIIETDSKVVATKGYVESNDVEIFSQNEGSQVSILCESAWLTSWSEQDEYIIDYFSGIENLFEFPFDNESHNLLPYPYHQTTRTNNGITYTDNGDGTITCNGTATATSSFVISTRSLATGTFVLKNGAYILSGCPSGGANSKYYLFASRTYNNSLSSYGRDEGNGLNLTLNGDDYSDSEVVLGVAIQIKQGTTVNNLTFRPMIRPASISDDTWQPYNNSTIEFSSRYNIDRKNIEYYGEISTGFIGECRIVGEVVGLTIYNVTSREVFTIEDDKVVEMIGTHFQSGDIITINTIVGQKSVRLQRGVQTYNLLPALNSNSKWVQLNRGVNDIWLLSESGIDNVEFTMKYQLLYQGA